MPTSINTEIKAIHHFLGTLTPDAWLASAIQQIPLLLIDHAHCERKAAGTALNLINKYAEKKELVLCMSALAREELLHFEKVLAIIHVRGIAFRSLKPSYYAQRLHKLVSNHDYIERMVDQLIVGAIIEARSCERFAALVPWLDDPILAKFYASLVKAEARHFQDYIKLAERYLGKSIHSRLIYFLELENELICAKDNYFRFHGGIPTINTHNGMPTEIISGQIPCELD